MEQRRLTGVGATHLEVKNEDRASGVWLDWLFPERTLGV